MVEKNLVYSFKELIETSMELQKCRKCGCMGETLKTVKDQLSKNESDETRELLIPIQNFIEKMKSIEYSWLGCKQCWSADIINSFDKVFPELNSAHEIECKVDVNEDSDFLPAIGEYHILSLAENCYVAISTLASIELADRIAELRPEGLSIVGKQETENIGIEKIIKNVLAVPSIKHMILCGKDSEGHFSGDALLSLINNGIDENMKIIGAKGRKPVLSNVTLEEVNSFRKQVELIDLIGCDNIDVILSKLKAIHERTMVDFNISEYQIEGKTRLSSIQVVNVVEKDPFRVKLDKAGYFVIVPKSRVGKILVEHFSNNNQLLRIIKGDNARDIYWTIIENGWITEISHAAYLGKELTKAEMSIKHGFKYIQDKA